MGVTGETGRTTEATLRRVDEPQPGGRPAAPGDLALAQAYLNSHYDLVVEHGADLFATPAGLARWLTGRGLLESGTRVSAAEHARGLAVREALRELAADNNEIAGSAPNLALARLDEAARFTALRVEFRPVGPRLAARETGTFGGALAAVLAIAAQAMLDGSWPRLKMCPGDDCGWVFYDHSRNGSGRWCSMAVCGGRAKARAHYRRRRGGA